MNGQRGALMFITPLLMVVVVLLSVLALDGARLYSLRQDMQAQANAAASAAAGITQTCTSLSGASTFNDIETEARRLAMESGWDGQGDFLAAAGVMEATDGEFAFRESGLLQANSVAIRYRRSAPISMLIPERFGRVGLEVTAASRKEVLATVSAVGTTAIAGGDTASATVLNSLLGGLFNGGSPYSFSPTSLNQLADVTVRLGDLLDDTGVGSVVNRLPVDAEGLAQALSTVLDGASPAGILVDDLLKNAAGLEGVSVEKVLKLAEDGAVVPENATIPVYDLLMSMTLNVLQGTSVMLNNIGVSIPGLANVGASIQVFNAPSVVVAPARQDASQQWIGHVETADVAIVLNAEINLNIIVLGTGVRVLVDLPIEVQTGVGTADLVRAECAQGLFNQVRFGVRGQSGVASVSGAADVNAQLALLGIPITLLGLRLNLDLPVGSNSFDVDSQPMPLDEPQPETISVGGGLGLGGITGANLTVTGSAHAGSFSCGLLCSALNLLLTPIIGAVNGILQSQLVGLVTNLLDAVIDPLLSGLGLSLGVVDIQISDAQQGRMILLEDLPSEIFDNQ